MNKMLTRKQFLEDLDCLWAEAIQEAYKNSPKNIKQLYDSAPDLLEALEALVAQVGDSHAYEELENARAVIAKARGEG